MVSGCVGRDSSATTTVMASASSALATCNEASGPTVRLGQATTPARAGARDGPRRRGAGDGPTRRWRDRRPRVPRRHPTDVPIRVGRLMVSRGCIQSGLGNRRPLDARGMQRVAYANASCCQIQETVELPNKAKVIEQIQSLCRAHHPPEILLPSSSRTWSSAALSRVLASQGHEGSVDHPDLLQPADARPPIDGRHDDRPTTVPQRNEEGHLD
jgi:hypothetical protein